MYRSVPKIHGYRLAKVQQLQRSGFSLISYALTCTRASCLGCSAVASLKTSSQPLNFETNCTASSRQFRRLLASRTDFVCLGLLRYIANAGPVLAGIMKITVACINRGVASKWIEFEYTGRTIPLHMQACDR